MLAPQTAEMELAVDELLKLLKHESRRVVISSLTAFQYLKPTLDFLGLREIMRAFRLGLVKCDELIVMQAARTLHAICESPRDEVKNFFAEDAELRSHAYAALAEELEDEPIIPVQLPTNFSLPVPLLDWRPTPIRLAEAPEPVQGADDATS